MRNKTILISGANGYIALHLTQLLKKLNYNVLRATREGVEGLEMDFSHPYRVSNINCNDIYAMIHTVSPNEELYKTDPYRALSENSSGIHAALDFCRKNNIKKFIYLSSFHVFGKQTGKITENVPPAPISDYGLAHLTAEQTIQLFDRNQWINAWIVRPSNLYGVPVDLHKFKRWNLIPFSFCNEVVKEKKITLMTAGNQLRNFVSVSDVCQKVCWILENSPKERVFHAYGNETISVYQFALLVKKVAQDVLQHSVEITRPLGNDSVIPFEFTSIYSLPDLLPKKKLETYVEDMIRTLLMFRRKD